MSRFKCLLAGVVVGLCGCGSEAEDLLRLPPGFPAPLIPAQNPLTAAKVELGRRLFYDKRLSGNGAQSCASCHKQELAFTDGLAQPTGSTGQLHPRSAMSLVNAGYASTLTWGNPLVRTLEEQALLPMFGERPVELGLTGGEEALYARLRADARYAQLFPESFPEEPTINLSTITRALAAFERTLISGRSPYDALQYGGQPDALDAAARRGMELFFSEKLECFHCHGGFNFSDATVHQNMPNVSERFHNTGLYNLDGMGAFPYGNQGVYEISGQLGDRGRFRAPSLRNVAVTAPYMHDGSIATLEEVLTQHYARGGRLISEGPNAGDGARSPSKSIFIRGFALSTTERDDVIAFLRSLTDPTFLTDPRFADPFAR